MVAPGDVAAPLFTRLRPAGWLWMVNADGTNAAPLTEKLFDRAHEASHRWPLFLPDGEHFLFYAGAFTNSQDDRTSGIYYSSVTGHEKKVILSTLSNPGYANGHLFYLDQKRSLRAALLDLSTGIVSGEPQLIADQVGFQSSVYWGAFSVAENGTVVYNPTVGAAFSVLTWYDRTGKEVGHVGDVGVMANPALSPDNARLSVDVADAKAGNVNLWLHDLNRGTSSRFTFDSTEDSAGTWSRDGSLLAYRASIVDTKIFLKQSQGLQPPKKIFEFEAAHSNDDIIPTSWSLDGKQILSTYQSGRGGSELVLLPASGGKLEPFLPADSVATAAQISPDGKWVAYASQESGDWEVYVTTFPSATGKWQVSRGGGTESRWRADGKEIFYIGPRSTLTAVSVNGEGTFSAGNPTPLFRTQLRAPVSSTDMFSYDVTKDGQRFLVDRYAKPQQVAPLHIVLNATAGLPK